MKASEALRRAARAALEQVPGIGRVHDPAPVQAALPHLILETGSERDWGHKSGAGRELRLAATVRDRGERPDTVDRLSGAVEAALAGIEGRDAEGWRIVSLALVRARLAPEPRSGGWAGLVEFRARMLEIAG